MKKLLVFIILAVAGYFAYDNFIKSEEPYELNASYNKQRESVDLDAPTIQPREFARYNGTIKNISDKTLTNIVITYLIDAQPSTATIDKLEPNEQKDFTTISIMLKHIDAAHHLESVKFEEQ